jgi:hypothetical protein
VKQRSTKRIGMEPWRIRQREAIAERSGGVCEFEMAVLGVMRGETHYLSRRIIERDGDAAWVRCAESRGLKIAHLPRRHKCGEIPTAAGFPLFLHPDVAIAGCDLHHVMYDSRLQRLFVRAPQDRILAARTIIETTLAEHSLNAKAAVGVDLSHL